MPKRFGTMAEVREANRRIGHHWFAPDTMRFFSSRVMSDLYDGRFFITQERTGWDHSSPRAYTVREALPDGSIATASKFQYTSLDEARAEARRLVRMQCQ